VTKIDPYRAPLVSISVWFLFFPYTLIVLFILMIQYRHFFKVKIVATPKKYKRHISPLPSNNDHLFCNGLYPVPKPDRKFLSQFLKAGETLERTQDETAGLGM